MPDTPEPTQEHELPADGDKIPPPLGPAMPPIFPEDEDQ